MTAVAFVLAFLLAVPAAAGAFPRAAALWHHVTHQWRFLFLAHDDKRLPQGVLAFLRDGKHHLCTGRRRPAGPAVIGEVWFVGIPIGYHWRGRRL